MSGVLQRSQYDLTSDGGAFLQAEARNASLFLLGELHGENEIPALIDTLWPVLWESGYRHVAAEVSPWAAHRLEFGNADGIYGLWTPREARTVSSLKNRADSAALWGCDIEDVQPQAVLRELAAANPTDDNLQAAVALAGNVYQRRMAAALLEAFAAGGKTALTCAPEDADERGDDPAFAYLASIARSANTVFDLRPIREMLHRIPNARRSATEASLAYWADSYDAIIAYREVTPIRR